MVWMCVHLEWMCIAKGLQASPVALSGNQLCKMIYMIFDMQWYTGREQCALDLCEWMCIAKGLQASPVALSGNQLCKMIYMMCECIQYAVV